MTFNIEHVISLEKRSNELHPGVQKDQFQLAIDVATSGVTKKEVNISR